MSKHALYKRLTSERRVSMSPSESARLRDAVLRKYFQLSTERKLPEVPAGDLSKAFN